MKKNALITGGSSGIGLAIAGKLLESGDWKVLSLSRSQLKIDRALEQHPEIARRIEFLIGDVSDPGEVERISELVKEKAGVLHALVNNAGVVSWGGMEATSVTVWQHILNVNITGPFVLTKALLPLLKKANGAAIVNISSIASKQPGTSIAYSVSKAGLDMMTEYLAGDLGPYNIRINAVNPGLVKTNLHLDNKVFTDRTAYEEMLAQSAARYPIGRIGKPEDIADLTAFLLSDQASWITGSIIKADGGTTLFNNLIPPKRM